MEGFMAETFWLRAETKKNEFRRALDPIACEKLLKAGHKVIVENWKDSIIPTDDYTAVGCQIVKAHSWIDADSNVIVVGLKALPENVEKFVHRHIFFAHVYKEQDGWREIMQKFETGGGKIIDLEFMTNDECRRVCAFGYWAGYVGAALGSLFSCADNEEFILRFLSEHKRFENKDSLIKFIKENTQIDLNNRPEAMVIGCAGRSGQGALDCLKELDWQVTGWDKVDTAAGGPFPQILNYQLFVNCVLAMEKMPPFIDRNTLNSTKSKLKVISDVSCDPDSDCNMVPLYSKATTLEEPFVTVEHNFGKIKLTAIDNLPSVLPKESSEDFSNQLLPYLEKYSEDFGPIKNALRVFYDILNKSH